MRFQWCIRQIVGYMVANKGGPYMVRAKRMFQPLSQITTKIPLLNIL